MILPVEIFSLDIEFCFLHGADFAADSGAAKRQMEGERKERGREKGERERERDTHGRERKRRVFAPIV
jgi:hypothetical protein